MKKHASCPWGGETYEKVMWGRVGRKPQTAEAQRKRIDELLDIMQSEGDFWTLEVIRRLLASYVLYDDRSQALWIILQDLNHADSKQAKKIQVFTSAICYPVTPRKRRKKP